MCLNWHYLINLLTKIGPVYYVYCAFSKLKIQDVIQSYIGENLHVVHHKETSSRFSVLKSYFYVCRFWYDIVSKFYW